MFEYSLWLHWKQGDDFHDLLERNKGNVAKALEDWAEEFEARAEHCREIAKAVKGKNIEAEADVHFINLFGDEKVLNELVKRELLQKEEIEVDEDEVN